MKKIAAILTLLLLVATSASAVILAGVLSSYRPQAPNAPTGVTATAGNTQNTVSWSAGATDGTHAPATSYTLYGDTFASPTTPRYTGSATSYTHTGLTNGTPYYYRLTASNLGGTSGYSSPDATATPVPFSAFTDTFTGSNGAALHPSYWTAPFAGTSATAAGYTANIQNNAASFTGAATGLTYGGPLVATAGSIPFANGRYYQWDFVTGRNPANTYSRVYLTGANTTYDAYGSPLTDFIYVTYTSSGAISLCFYNSSTNSGEIVFSTTYSGTQTVKVVLNDASHITLYVGGAQVGTANYTNAIFPSWGSTVAMRLGVVVYGTTTSAYVYDNVSIQ